MGLNYTDKQIKYKASFILDTDNRAHKPCVLHDEDEVIYILNERSFGLVWDEAKGENVTSTRKVTAEDFDAVYKTQCRKCKGKITKYEKNYWRYNHSFGSRTMTLYCFENGYCEECAKEYEKQKIVRPTIWEYERKIVNKNTVQLVGDNAPTVIQEYEDGTIYEEYPFGLPSGLASDSRYKVKL